MKKVSIIRACAAALVSMGLALCAAAQYNHPKEPIDPSLSFQMVKTGLHMISGKGGNSLLRLSGNGLILVDGNLPGKDEAVLKAVNRISDQPVKLVILTNSDTWSSNDSKKFLDTGALLAVQENAKQKVMASVPSETAAQIKTYDREQLIRLGGVEAQLMHFGNAHSNADTVVYFPNLKVVAVGDLYASTLNPDYSAGGSLVGWGPALAQLLKMDFDTAVPGSGPTVSRAELESFMTKINTLVARAASLVSQGVSKDQLMSRLKADDPGWNLNFTAEQIDGFYAELLGVDKATHAAQVTASKLQH
jgi:cyclase